MWDKYTARTTGCMETSTLARHGRSVSAASAAVRERFLQIARNKSFFRFAGRGVQRQRLRGSSSWEVTERRCLYSRRGQKRMLVCRVQVMANTACLRSKLLLT